MKIRRGVSKEKRFEARAREREKEREEGEGEKTCVPTGKQCLSEKLSISASVLDRYKRFVFFEENENEIIQLRRTLATYFFKHFTRISYFSFNIFP